MGIPGLQKFMKADCIGGFEPVNLAEIVELYKNDTGKNPVMLVDISSCILHLTPFNEGKPFIGRNLKTLKRNLEILINKCSNLGVKLLVIGDGMKPNEKFQSWIENCEKQIDVLKIFYSQSKITSYETFRRFDFGILLTAAVSVFHSTDKCEYQRAVYEADDYILDYINKFKCFAILTEDSDFIIAEGARYCISVKDLDLHSMTSYNYNRYNLANFLDMTTSHLPLYGLLCNEILSIPKMKNDWKNRFFKVAELLRNYSSTEIQNADFLENCLGVNNSLSLKIRERLERYCGNGKIGITYTNYENWNNILTLAEIRHTSDVTHKNLLEILSDHQVYYSPLWCNVLRPSSVSALKPLRKRMYEFLFHEYPKAEEIFITEHVFQKSYQKRMLVYFADKIKVDLGQYPHSGLCKLWAANPPNKIKAEKLQIFCQLINKKLNHKDLNTENVSEELIFPLLAAFYLLWEVRKNFKNLEIRTLLIQAVLTNQLSEEEAIKYSDEFNIISFDLSEWFIRVIDHLRLLNNACGEPFCVLKTNLMNYFDSKLLHNVYKKASTQNIGPGTWGPKIWLQYTTLEKKLYELGAICGHI